MPRDTTPFWMMDFDDPRAHEAFLREQREEKNAIAREKARRKRNETTASNPRNTTSKGKALRKSKWLQLNEARTDKKFLDTMGVKIATFDFILERAMFSQCYYETSMKDTSREEWAAIFLGLGKLPQAPRTYTARPLDAAGCLALVLHHLASTMTMQQLCDKFAMKPMSCTRFLRFGLDLLHETLDRIVGARIKWPKQDTDFKLLGNMLVARRGQKTMLTNVFGTVETFKINLSFYNDEPQLEAECSWPGMLRNKVENVICLDPRGRVISADLDIRGDVSNEDKLKEIGLYHLLAHKTPAPHRILSDITLANPYTSTADRIKRPLKSDSAAFRDPVKYAHIVEGSKQIAAEMQYSNLILQKMLSKLKRLNCSFPFVDNGNVRELTIAVCLKLHNLTISFD